MAEEPFKQRALKQFRQEQAAAKQPRLPTPAPEPPPIPAAEAAPADDASKENK